MNDYRELMRFGLNQALIVFLPSLGPVFITGASSGIGAAIAWQLARRGYTTVLLGRRRDRLKQLADQCQAHAPCSFEVIDLTQTDQLAGQMDRLIHRHGPAQILINSAGAGTYGRFLDLDPEDEERLYRLNYVAASRLVRSVLPHMVDSNHGYVINIASISAKMSPWGHAAYTPTKAALIALTQTLAAEYARTGVRFSYVQPGIVNTQYFNHSDAMRALWQVVKPHAIGADHVARQVVKLLDRPRLELCIPRTYRVLDLLRTLSPTKTHRLVARRSQPKQDDI